MGCPPRTLWRKVVHFLTKNVHIFTPKTCGEQNSYTCWSNMVDFSHGQFARHRLDKLGCKLVFFRMGKIPYAENE